MTLKKINLETIKTLRAKLKNTPENPGIYIHKNASQDVLYVGKAKNLYNRLHSYFYSFQSQSMKTQSLISQIHDFDFVVTQNEQEALILENNFIKHNKPPFNILLRDDKTYPYLRINIKDPWSRVTLVRRKKSDDAIYFGPYVEPGKLDTALTVIHRYFPIVKCSPYTFKTVTRPCNYYDIKKCLAPCHKSVSKDEYNSYISSIIEFLSGKTTLLRKKLRDEIYIHAKKLEFEKASILRDQLLAIEDFEKEKSVSLHANIDFDIISGKIENKILSIYFAHIKSGQVVGSQGFLVQTNTSFLYDNLLLYQSGLFRSAILRFYDTHSPQKNVIILDDENIIQTNELNEIRLILNKSDENIRLYEKDEFKKVLTSLSLTKRSILIKQFDKLCETIETNALIKLEDALKVEESSLKRLKQLKQILELKTIPHYIECYDISTFQGSETVASQVVFREGQASKKDYRKYVIKDVIGKNDDFSSLREVFRRRFRDFQNENTPNLIVIDGGAPQLREVLKTLQSLEVTGLNVIGIAKSRVQRNFSSKDIKSSKERIVLPIKNKTNDLDFKKITLQQGSPEFQILTQLRDEAHRFAITFHRKRRSQSSKKSLFNSIKGLGPKRKKKLFEVTKDINFLLKIDSKELAIKTKIPIHILKALKDAIKNKLK